MASGSLAIPQTSDMNSVHAFDDNYPSHMHSTDIAVDTIMSDVESELSDLAEAHDIEIQESVKEDDFAEVGSSRADASATPESIDVDGSQDGDYAIEDSQVSEDEHRQRSERSASSDSKRPPKRKATSIEDDEYIMNNPELYGLRRSSRAHTKRRMIESSSDENDSDSDVVVRRVRPRRRPALSQKSSKRPTPAIRSQSDSESSSDSYGESHRSSRRRRRLQTDTNVLPIHAELRFSTRRAAKVSTYNEDDNDPFSEEDDDYTTPSYWTAALDDSTPAIDVVLNHRVKEGISKDHLNLRKDDFEYFIKWQGKAHIHASWENTTDLANCRSIRRLDNYYRKIVVEDVRMHNDPDVLLEDKEKWILDRERDLEAIEDYTKVERVIGCRDDNDGATEYYVKWKGLFYDSCTWESADVVSKVGQQQIDRYLDRVAQLPTSNKVESNPSTRRKFEPLKEQPSYVVGGKLKDFQVTGLNFLAYNWCNVKNVILADEMGLGKTVQTISFMAWLRHNRQQNGPFIVVVPLSTMPSWAETFDFWTPDINYVVYNGNETARNIIKEYELLVDKNPKRSKFHVLLTTYEYILADSSFLSQLKWQFMAVDEAHRLKNRESQLYSKLLDFKAPSRLLITGTPMQNTLGELSALMDFLMPGAVNIDDDMDCTSEEAVKKIEEIQKAINPYMLRRTKQTVQNDLPGKTEKILRVELSDVQLEYYKHILTKNYTALNQGAKGPKQSLLNIMMELKKASNHPFMFPNAEERILADKTSREDILRSIITSSGKMMLLDKLLAKLKQDNHRILIFSQMVKMLDIIGEYLHLRGHPFQRLDGTIASGPRRIAIDHFNAEGSNDFCFLLSTRAGGLGINLMTADTVILFDSDWNPQADLQAMARAHRIGQTKAVNIYRFVSKETVEEEVLERARNKLMLEYVTIHRGGLDKRFQEAADKIARTNRFNEPSTSEDISLILKRRGQKMFEQTGNQKKLEEMDIDTLLNNAEEHKTEQVGMEADGGEGFLKAFEYTDVSFDKDWDDIIPKEQLAEIKAEEKRKAEAKFLEDMIEQNAPRKRKSQAVEDRDERAAKKQARALAAQEASDESDEDVLDPKRPLVLKEYRNLIRAFLRYGSIEDCREELIKDARLVGRDYDLLKSVLDDVISISKDKLAKEQARVEAIERTTNKLLTKKDRKAVLFDYNGVKRVNAETIVERPIEMKMVREVVGACTDLKSFRLLEATKTASYSCEWGAKEDGMLLVGIARHGFGAWTDIRDDSLLELQEKLFLEEHRIDKKEERKGNKESSAKSPGAVHLVRRADYLLSVLKEKTSNGTNLVARKAVENHHRNNKKTGINGRRVKGSSVSASPAPYIRRKGQRESPHDRSRGYSYNGYRDSVERRVSNGYERGSTPRPDSRHKQHGEHHRRHLSHDSLNYLKPAEDNSLLRMLFKPLRQTLKMVHSATKDNYPQRHERASVIRDTLREVGSFIKDVVSEQAGASSPDGNESPSSSEPRLWAYVAQYWPNQETSPSQLQDMYERIINYEKEESNKADENQGHKIVDNVAKINGEKGPDGVKAE